MPVKERKTARFNITATESQKEYVEKYATELGISASEFIGNLIDSHRDEMKNEMLRRAAQSLLDEYKNNRELTAFTAMDGEPFL